MTSTENSNQDGPRPPVTSAGDLRPREEHLEQSFDRILGEGKPRLSRSWTDLISTGTVGGAEVALGVLALLYVDNLTGNPLLGALAFSIGFIALLLGHSELFTEGFLVPVTVVVAREARIRDLVKLWAGTLLGNLIGGWALSWLIDRAYPTLRHEAVTTARYYITAGINLRTFCLAVLAGSAITLLTRMHRGTDDNTAKVIASVAIAFLLSGTRLFHSVLDSLLAFTALNTNHAPFGYADWFGWFSWTVLGNVAGGLGLTTMLRLVRSRRRLIDQRASVRRRVGRRRG